MPHGPDPRATEEKLELLANASNTLLGSPKVADLLPSVLEFARKLNAAEACAIWRFEAEIDAWKITSAVGLSPQYQKTVIPKGIAVEPEEGPLYVEDTHAFERFQQRLPLYDAENIRALMVLPMKSGDKPARVLVFYFHEPHRFTEEEVQAASALANLAASAVETGEMNRERERTRHRAAFLAEAGEVLASSLDYPTTLSAVVRLAISHIADWCLVHTVQPDGSLKQLAAHSDPDKQELVREHLQRYPPRPDATTGPTAVARTGKSEIRSVVSDRMLRRIATDEAHLELLRSMGFASFMCVPLIARGHVLGTITFVSASPDNHYSLEDLALAEDLARRAALAMDNARLYEAAHRERAALETALSALRENEERLLMSLDAGRMGIWDWDVTTNSLKWTDNLITLLGFPPGGFNGTFDALISVIHPDDRPGFQTAVDRTLALKSYFETEFRIVLPDGGIRWMAAKGRVFCGEHGEAIRVSGLGMDVTERHLLEEKLRKSQKLESIGLLAGGIAHDFNNLLTGIMGNASLALDVIPRDSAAQQLVQSVVRASERAASLTQQLLAYSGKGKFIVQPLDLSSLVRQIGELVRATIPKLVDLEFDLAPSLPAIEADVSQIQQVVMNLVINAAESIVGRPGRVLVRTGTQSLDEREIRNHALPDELTPGSYVWLEVQDTGCGMDADTQAKIFDPFFTTKFTGRGLGLAAVSGIVRGHHGAIRVYSAPGRGSMFRVLFPAAAAVVPIRSVVSVSENLNGSGLVLVIDDEPAVRTAAEAALHRYGYRSILAENGPAGIAAFRQAPDDFAVVLLDLTMPVIGGEETFRILRRYRPDIPVIASSGYSESEASSRFPPGELNGFLQKPYSPADLARTLKDVLPGRIVRRRTSA
jgi:signal transduction histidine kinase/CheY-like chemotaxis protein